MYGLTRPRVAVVVVVLALAVVTLLSACAAPPPPVYKVGDTITSGNWRYTVTGVSDSKTVPYSDFGNTFEAKGVWLIVDLTIENIGNETSAINTWDFEVKDGAGTTYSTAFESISYSSYKKSAAPGDQLPPNVPVSIALLYDVDPAASGFSLSLRQAGVTVQARR